MVWRPASPNPRALALTLTLTLTLTLSPTLAQPQPQPQPCAGWRPAGLQRLSETTVDNVQVIQDYGQTYG